MNEQIRSCLAGAVLALAATVVACNTPRDNPSPPPGNSGTGELMRDCVLEGCARLGIAGHRPAQQRGTFRGHADPSLSSDPHNPARVWLAYSWPHAAAAAPPNESTIVHAVTNHLARSDDGGRTFRHVKELWPEINVSDPEGSGQNGSMSSETASLTWLTNADDTVTWYGGHLRYFLQPKPGYQPKFATSWTVRIAAASSPEALSDAPETVLGLSTTADVYNVDARLDTLAGLPITQCAILNNPDIFAENGTLYLIVDCLAFQRQKADFAKSTIQVFATTPTGAPSSWKWRHVGKIADASLAAELGDPTLQQPDVSRAADGTLLLVVTPAYARPNSDVGAVNNGCAAVELVSLDPPVVRRDSDGRAVVRSHISGIGHGACTHDAASATGMLIHKQGTRRSIWQILQTMVRP